MDFNESTYNLFDDFLSGKLSDGGKLDFEKSLSENASIRDEFSFYKAAVTTIRMSGNQILKKQIATVGMGIPATAFQNYIPSLKPKHFLKKYWWAVSIAAAGIIALTIWLVAHPSPKEKTDVAPEILLDTAAQTKPQIDSCDSVAIPPVKNMPQPADKVKYKVEQEFIPETTRIEKKSYLRDTLRGKAKKPKRYSVK